MRLGHVRKELHAVVHLDRQRPVHLRADVATQLRRRVLTGQHVDVPHPDALVHQRRCRVCHDVERVEDLTEALDEVVPRRVRRRLERHEARGEDDRPLLLDVVEPPHLRGVLLEDSFGPEERLDGRLGAEHLVLGAEALLERPDERLVGDARNGREPQLGQDATQRRRVEGDLL